jgi:hypothetical protein
MPFSISATSEIYWKKKTLGKQQCRSIGVASKKTAKKWVLRYSADEHARLARCAQHTVFQINPLHCVGWRHRALIIIAVREIERVPKLVDGFFQQSLLKNGAIGG